MLVPLRRASPRTHAAASLPAAVILAYGAGLFLVLHHHAAGAHEASEPPLLLHWVRDATLALPAVALAVWLARLLTASAALTRPRLRAVEPMLRALAVSAAAGAAFAAGTPVHAWLFAAEHAGGGAAAHALADGFHALLVAVPLAMLTELLTSSVRGVRRLGRVVAAGAVAAALAGTAYADVQDESALRDVITPCFNDSPVGPPFAQPMAIPPLAKPQLTTDVTTDTYRIVEQRSETEIVPGVKTPVWTYDGVTPGPTILARKGRAVRLTLTNDLPANDDPSSIIYKDEPSENHESLPSSTSLHLHGINADHHSDGYATDNRHKHRRNPGESLAHVYRNHEYQRPATLWYHDHSIHITSPNVYRGLAGMYIVEDAIEETTGLPGTESADPGRGYGHYDIPLMLKDVMIDPTTGILVYDNCSHMGAYGDVMTMNGKQQPRFDVATRKYRFRMLNGSDARQYLVAIRTLANLKRPVGDETANEPFFFIGTDHGLLRNPEVVTKYHTTPSERHEVVFDFSRYPVGTRLVMVNLLADPDEPKLFPLMAFDVTRVEPDPSRVPPVLRPDADATDAWPDEHPADDQPPAKTRVFEFHKSNGPYWSINGKIFDPNRDDALPVVNTNEDWILVNDSGGWGHPVHLHLGRFKIVNIDGRKPLPGELTGWKDTVWLGPNQRITVRHQFWNFNDRFVFHCHNGSHEDFDMMGQFNVQPSAPGEPSDTTPPSAVSILTPMNATTVSGTNAVTASALDDVAVAGVRFSLDGAALGNDTTPPYAFEWNTKTASDGAHTLTAIAYDTSGNENISAPVRVTVDNSIFR